MKKFPLASLALLAFTTFLARAALIDENQALQILTSTAGPAEKEAACLRLKQIGSVKAIPALAALLTEENLAQWALDALETLPAPEADTALYAALSTTTGKTKAGVIHALGQRRQRQSVPDLDRLLADPDPMIAIASAQALGKIGGPEAMAALSRAKTTPTAPIHTAIVNAQLACAERLLAEDHSREAAAIYQQLRSAKEPDPVPAAAFRGLALSSRERAVPLVADALTGSNAAEQAAAIQLVRELPQKEITAVSAAALSKVAPTIQIALLETLRQRGDPAAATAVASASQSPDASVRMASFHALGDLGDASQVPQLAEAAATATGAEREAARQSLANLRRGDVVAALLASVAQVRPAVQVELIQALAGRPDPRAVPALLKLAAMQESQVALPALLVLRKLADDAHIDALLELILRAQTAAAREAAGATFATAGSRSKHPNAFSAAALKALPDADVPTRCALLQAAGRIGGPGVLEALRAGLKDPSPEVRDATLRTMADTAGVEALPDLLALSRQAPTDTEKTLALRGYWRLAGILGDRPTPERLEVIRDGLTAARRAEDKKPGLGRLADLVTPGALELAEKYYGDPPVRTEAEYAAYQIATRLDYSHLTVAEAALRRLARDAASAGIRADAQGILTSLEQHSDYVVPWQVSGPYRQEGKEAQQLFDVPFPPEQSGAATNWRALPISVGLTNSWRADLDNAVGGNHCVVYLKTRVFSPQAQTVALEIGTDDGVKLWVNNTLVHANNAVRGFAPGQDRAQATLKQGWNEFLLKITQHTAGCTAAVRLRNTAGATIPGLRIEPGN
jgi:HEAT repeat protein